MLWRPALQSFGPFVNSLGNNPATLELEAVMRTPKSAPSDSTMKVVGDLRNFQVQLLSGAPMIRVDFDRLRFVTETGKSADVDVDIRQARLPRSRFEFVDDLRKYISSSNSGGFLDRRAADAPTPRRLTDPVAQHQPSASSRSRTSDFAVRHDGAVHRGSPCGSASGSAPGTIRSSSR